MSEKDIVNGKEYSITKIPDFVLRDMWISEQITSEEYSNEVKRRQDEKAALIDELERYKLALDIIIEKTKDAFVEPATRHNVNARMKLIRNFAEKALNR